MEILVWKTSCYLWLLYEGKYRAYI